jgi:hypothetical protein
MWIEMLETWTIPLDRIYLKGMKYDIPLKTLNQIRAKGRHLWRKTIAPWLDASIIPNYGVPERPPVHAGSEPEV